MAQTYAGTTIKQLFDHITKNYADPKEIAKVWIEAENIFAFRALICDWFKAMQDDSANKRFPDYNNRLSQKRANKIIDELENDFELEIGRYYSLQKDAPPGFRDRLMPHAKLALAQQIKKLVLSEKKLKIITEKRYKKMDFPPGVIDLIKDAQTGKYNGTTFYYPYLEA